MQHCPAEILELIFAEACTDDGYTGRSLALVSKRIHDASSRHALQSIAVYGSHQLSAFAALLEGRKEEDCRVRHLYLTDRRRVWMEYAPGQDKAQWFSDRLKEDFHVIDPTRDYSADPILRILRIVAPHLRTLTFLLFDSYDENPLAMPFPALEELTLHASSVSWTGSSCTPTMPALRYLHIIQDYSLPRLLVKTVANLAPHLTHLRISRLSGSPVAFGDVLQGLERMLAAPDHSAGDAQPTLPSSLERVIVQMSQQALYDTSHTLQLLTSPAAYLLRDIARRDTRKRVVLVRPVLWTTAWFGGDDKADVEYYTGIKASWQSRILGEDGVWRIEPADILGMHGVDEESS
ncbi:hypothetical protein BV20DRAFT_1037652 [Pilatotrama ljubarskyi]|nr:hypothetical protein BV20DRAFT_1037652 [Pilatotrama ljubarskyi]